MNKASDDLIRENAILRERLAYLEGQLRFLSQHERLAAGIRGEEIVAGIVAGELTGHTTGHDIETASAKIEVKYSNLSAVGLTTKRWQWQKIFGQTGGKHYDFLLLVGQADTRFVADYRDSASPYVLFLIPYAEVMPLTVKGSPRGIVVNSNPLSARGVAADLFRTYQITIRELEVQFRL